MRRLRNLDLDRTRRLGRQHRYRRIAALSVVLAAAALGAGVSAVGAAEPGCGGKPGGKDEGAALQYCPKEVPLPPGDRETDGGTGAGPVTGPASNGGEATGKKEARATEISAGAEIPLLGYPSTSGVNTALLALLIGGVAMGGFLGYRRLRGSNDRPELH